ncbi:TIGR04222 domain-containing membrane protein [Streptomyces sp. NPDC012794]|uniref:TIGR04222 domain-containing membrane protein n=1 Tax=Streptomyces sp. NPDC012794 TaxID=3364850 RepID=UPI00367E74F3
MLVITTGAAWFLLLTGAALRLRPGPDRLGRPLSPAEAALLRGGGRAAAQTGMVELYLAGSVEAGWQQTVRPAKALLPRPCSEVARAQYHALYGARHPRGLLRDSERVQEAVHAMSAELERARLMVSRRRVWCVRVLLLPVCAAPLGSPRWLGLLAALGAAALWIWPRRTLRGSALLAKMRLDHAGAREATVQQPDQLLLSVALFGTAALRAQLPRFAEESGLLTRPPREPMDRGGSGSGEPFASCGG